MGDFGNVASIIAVLVLCDSHDTQVVRMIITNFATHLPCSGTQEVEKSICNRSYVWECLLDLRNGLPDPFKTMLAILVIETRCVLDSAQITWVRYFVSYENLYAEADKKEYANSSGQRHLGIYPIVVGTLKHNGCFLVFVLFFADGVLHLAMCV